ncbi:CDP-alcohol phosphatidyltransferase family protein [Candidatus Uhrbacteria bacterium]|nr:CDP-alcohol phosphatidyltransferase family protein [Candidatus Uhrbacteria bacterium]
MMSFPSFCDRHYYPAEKVLVTDRIIAALFLWAVPSVLTPNHITLFRIVATVPTITLLLFEQYAVGIPLFLFVALTDALDGALARTRNMITDWGRIFDPVADKLLVIPSLAILMVKNLPIELVLLIIALELFVMGAALVWRNRGGVISANMWGKVKMILQIVGIFLLLLSLWLGFPTHQVAALVLGASVYCSIMSIVYHGI